MFTEEELVFIKTMMLDELASIERKRNVFIKDKKDVQAYNEFIWPREEFIKEILKKV